MPFFVKTSPAEAAEIQGTVWRTREEKPEGPFGGWREGVREEIATPDKAGLAMTESDKAAAAKPKLYMMGLSIRRHDEPGMMP
jgi:hypothetical protein